MSDDFEKYAGFSRRHFLAAAAGLSTLALTNAASAQKKDMKKGGDKEKPEAKAGHVTGGEVIKVGVIATGGRGRGAAMDCVRSSEGVEIVAIGDLFEDRVKEATEKLTAEIGDKFKATPETTFFGFDAYEKVLKTDCDLVILAAPPGFRPLHLRAAIEAGKHVFMEKPVAVDPVGVRSIIETADIAKNKNLAIVAGTQRRHDPVYIETIKRIKDGAIGELVSGQCYWCQELLWSHDHKPEWSDMEWQCRNWLYFDWLSGDHIVEQHVHNIDVMNWLFDGPPVSAFGMGGRQARTDAKFGNIYDHFAIEFEYPDGQRVFSQCRQMEGASGRVSEYIAGTRGSANPFGEIKGRKPWKYKKEGENVNPYVQEHADLIKSIRNGKPLNEAKRIAESTMTAIMGRMSAYTGRQVSWKWIMNASKLDLTPEKYELGPNTYNPVPMPGKTELI